MQRKSTKRGKKAKHSPPGRRGMNLPADKRLFAAVLSLRIGKRIDKPFKIVRLAFFVIIGIE